MARADRDKVLRARILIGRLIKDYKLLLAGHNHNLDGTLLPHWEFSSECNIWGPLAFNSSAGENWARNSRK